MDEPDMYFYHKYFDVPVTFLSDRPIPGCKFIEAFPRDIVLYKNETRLGVGKMIKDALCKIDSRFVIIMMTDIFPVRPVDIDAVTLLAQYMVEHPNVARGNLFSGFDEYGGSGNAAFLRNLALQSIPITTSPLDIRTIPSDNTSNVGPIGSTHLGPALWNKDFLLEFIEDDWYLDTIEFPGQRKFQRQRKWYSIVTIPPLMDIGHLCITAAPRLVRLSTIEDKEDRDVIARFIPEGFEVE
jgi:hypothetical protein